MRNRNDYFKKYREKNRIKLRAYNRKYNRLWRGKNGYGSEERYAKKYPEKILARRMLRQALRLGKIKKGRCEICKKPNVHGHHDDYFKPLDVRWLCPVHHAAAHKKLSTP